MKAGITIAIYFLVSVLYAQHRPIKQYTTRDGLGHSIVYRITQTRDGFLWFSTDNGLTRYDGTTFENYTAKDGLESNFIFGVAETDTAMLIASFGAGIASYHPDTGIRLNQYPHDILYPIDIIQSDTDLWVTDRYYKLYQFGVNGFHQWQSQDSATMEAHQIIFKLIKTPGGHIWGGFGYGISKYNIALRTFESVHINGLPQRQSCSALLVLEEDKFLAAMDKGIYHVDVTRNTATLIMQGNFYGHTQALFKDKEGNIWISDLQGTLWVLSPDFKQKERLLNGVIVNNILQDSDHNIWLATYGQGVLRLPPLYVKSYTPPVGMLVTDILVEKSSQQPIVVSSHYETNILKGDSLQPLRSRQLPAILRKKRISSIISPHDDEYVMGTYSYLYRERSGVLDSIRGMASVASLYKSLSGDYWSGHRMGLMKIDKNFKTATVIDAFSNRIIRSISEDIKGNIILGTDEGLYISQGDSWRVLNKSTGLPNNYVNVVFWDVRSQSHWIGTNEGLCRLDGEQKLIQYNHPLARLRCNSIATDKYGNTWIATTQGLVKYNHDKFELFDEQDGIPTNIYKLVYDARTDVLYALSWNALTLIETEKLLNQQSDRAPGIVISDILSNGTSVLKDDTHTVLPTPSGYVTLKYSVPYFKNKAGWKAYYRTNDDNWIGVPNLGEATIHHLPFGEIDVHLKIVDGNQNQLSATHLKFFNPEPLYRKLWFQIFCCILAFSLVVFFTKIVLQKKARKKELALLAVQQRMDLEHKALRNMLNPHFMNNAINSIQAFVTRNDQRETLRYLAKFARLMRGNLELLESSVVTIEKELQNLDLYLSFETLRFSGNLTYTIKVEEDVNERIIKLPSLVLQPFVENSIWHGILPKQEPGHVLVHVSKKGNSLHIIIDDDGIGLEESRKRKQVQPVDKPSRGLSIIDNRFLLLNRLRPGHSFTMEDKKTSDPSQRGTRVEIIVPAHY